MTKAKAAAARKPAGVVREDQLAERNLLRPERVRLTETERVFLRGDQVVGVYRRHDNRRACERMAERKGIDRDQLDACEWLYNRWRTAGLDPRVSASYDRIAAGEQEMTASQIVAWREYMDATRAIEDADQRDAAVMLCTFDIGVNEQLERIKHAGRKGSKERIADNIRAGLDVVKDYRRNRHRFG